MLKVFLFIALLAQLFVAYRYGIDFLGIVATAIIVMAVFQQFGKKH